MKRNLKTIIILFAAIIFMYQENVIAQKKKTKAKVPPPMVADRSPVKPEVAFTVSMSKPWTHLLEVEMRIKSGTAQVLNAVDPPDEFKITLPVWTPGSYLVREYARHVQDFAVKDMNGKALSWRKTDKNDWQIDSKGVREFVVTYNVYANELTVRTNELNADHAFFTPAALLMYPKDFLNLASTVTVKPYGNWKVATGLPKLGENTFKAENFDILYDSPFEVGNFKEISFTVQGKPHRYVVEGEGNYNLEKMATDTAKIVEEAYKIFGELPYNDYTFILNTRGGGGLEHLNSTALQFNKYGFTGDSYVDFLSLVAHEYFHCFNVKRIRPDALGPFDYQNENYTKLLWVAEGGTEYFSTVLMQRAGFVTDREFLAGKSGQFKALQERPGRFQQSVEESSYDAWIKYYRQDENAINNQISYYDKGEVVNFLLDLEIRSASNGAKSLDDVMRYLYSEHYKKGKNYTPEEFQKIAEMMAGKSLDDFFSRYIRGRDEIDYNAILGGLGLQMNVKKGRGQAYIGATLRETGDRLTVTAVPAGTPAYEQGLNSNDQIVAIDGQRSTLKFFTDYLAARKAGDKVKLTIFRFDALREIEITLGSSAPTVYGISSIDNPSDAQRALYRGYFGTDL